MIALLMMYDIRHYHRMIVALTETGRCMEEVDVIGVVSV